MTRASDDEDVIPAAPQEQLVRDEDQTPGPADGADGSDHLIVARGISKKYAMTTHAAMAHGIVDLASAILGRRHKPDELRSQEFWALRNVDFELRRGESVGVLGVNGAGKSTLLRLLYGLSKPDEGTVEIRGSVGGLLSVGAGFNPVLTGRENAIAELSLHGHRGSEAEALEQIAEFADIGAFMDSPIRTYSQGMRLRLGYAITAFLDPDVMLVDEVLSVGDTAFREKCARHIRAYLERGGSMILVSHSVWMVEGMCERAIVLDKGQVAFEGTATDATRHYLEVESLPATGAILDEAFSAGDGTMPITIEKVVIESPDGSDLAYGNPAQVTVDFRSSEHYPDTVWAVVLWSADELAVLAGAMTEDWGDLEVAEGSGRLRCSIPALPLAAGNYALRVAALDAETRIALGLHGFARNGTTFRVEGAAPSALFERLTGAPITTLDVAWVQGASDASPDALDAP
ncbi:MAG: ATP-binding cassette protein [Ilumatobacteraceae bacterium]|nr:ATP-binding cassette protein [Ilumatobacteraceae bacterium]